MKQHCLIALTLILVSCAPDDSAEPPAAAVAPTRAPLASDLAAPTSLTEIAPKTEVIALEFPYGETPERNLNGYFVLPADVVEPLPAVIMIHEQWGLNDVVRAMARRLAGEGYAVLAVDLFGDEVPADPEDAERLAVGLTDQRPAVLDNLRQAHGYLAEYAEAPRIAMLGWGLGGGSALESGIDLGDAVNAVVMYYGEVINDDRRLQPLRAPLLGIFAARDESISVNDVQRFRRRLRELGKDSEILIYTGVAHAFANPDGAMYDAEAADEAWNKTLEFLAQQLR